MNNRERFLKIMNFEPVDRLPVMLVEGVEQPTLARWRREGLPEFTTHTGFPDFFGMDRLEYVPVDLHPFPHFETRVLEENEEYTIEIDPMGIKVRRDKKWPTYVYAYLDHPVKDRSDWKRLIEERFDPDDPGRYPADWGLERVQHYHESDHPIGVLIYPFFFRHVFYSMGMERFMITLHDDPGLIHDMFEYNAYFCVQALKRVFDTIQIDFATIAEDMAYKTSTHVSPKMYREFWFPHQKWVMNFLREKNVPLIGLWNSGNSRPLMPLFIELGYNLTFPVESQAGLHVVDLMKEYGTAMRYFGNIPIQSISHSKEAIRQEVKSRVLPLVETGGFIPAPDDIIPPETPLENFAYYVELLKEINRGEAI